MHFIKLDKVLKRVHFLINTDAIFKINKVNINVSSGEYGFHRSHSLKI
jgi:hypothetical protein